MLTEAWAPAHPSLAGSARPVFCLSLLPGEVRKETGPPSPADSHTQRAFVCAARPDMTSMTIEAQDVRLALSHLILSLTPSQGPLRGPPRLSQPLCQAWRKRGRPEASHSLECIMKSPARGRKGLCFRQGWIPGLHCAALVLQKKVVTVSDVIWPGSSERGHFASAP